MKAGGGSGSGARPAASKRPAPSPKNAPKSTTKPTTKQLPKTAPKSTRSATTTPAAKAAPALEMERHGMSKVGQVTRDAIVEGAYDVLQEEGIAGISTRRIAARANVNQALVHYHFGSVDHLMVEVLNRLSSTVMSRNRDHYTGDESFGVKYRRDMKDLLSEDLRSTWGKVWLEAIALALNSPELLEPFLAEQRRPARGYVEEQALQSMGRSDKDARHEAEGIAALISIVRSGLVIDRLTGTTRGHAQAIELLGQFLDERTSGPAAPKGAAGKPTKAAATKPTRRTPSR